MNSTGDEKLREFYKNLEGENDPQKVVSVLDDLYKCDISKDQIISSQLGVLVNNIRKMGLGEDVTKTSEKVLMKWKPLMISPAKRSASSASVDPVEDVKKKKEENKPNEVMAQEISKEEYDEIIKSYLTGTETRDKSVEMLIRALMVDVVPPAAPNSAELKKELYYAPDDIVCSVAHAIEGYLFNHNSCEVSTAYKQSIRTKYLNLSNKANGKHLRFGLLSEAITPPKFCEMTPQVIFSC
jgi:hypothetical protein